MNQHRAEDVAIDLRDPALYINRELSQLEFNRRVLAQAQDPSVPLLERLRFLCITCTNLDEFFEIRAATVLEQKALGVPVVGPDGLAPDELLARIRERSLELVEASTGSGTRCCCRSWPRTTSRCWGATSGTPASGAG